MKTNIEVVKAAGLYNLKPTTIITVEEMVNYPENKGNASGNRGSRGRICRSYAYRK